MLDNTFDEEYYRLENVINTNHTSFSVDREGKLLLTHPFFKDSQITEVLPRDTGVNILPDNVNLIIDNIDLFSTNPFCQNYLPLRIPFGTGKPNVEFGDINFTQLDNFKVIVDPLIPFDTFRNHRYSNSENYLVDTTKLVITNFSPMSVLNNGTFKKFMADTTDDVFQIQMILYTNLFSVVYLLSVINLRTRETKILDISNFKDAIRFINIYTSDSLCLVVCESATGEMYIYDITLPMNTSNEFLVQYGYPDWEDVKLITISQDNEFVVVYQGLLGVAAIDVITKTIPDVSPPPVLEVWAVNNTIAFDFGNILSAGVFFTNRIFYLIENAGTVTLADVQIFTTPDLGIPTVTLMSLDVTDIINSSTIVPILPSSLGFLNVQSYTYLGGDSISNPNFSIFYWNMNPLDSTECLLTFINFPTYGSKRYLKYDYVFKFIEDTSSLQRLYFNLKTYLNQVYTFSNTNEDKSIYAWNLDLDYSKNNVFKYSYEKISTVSKLTLREINCVNFAKDYFLLSGLTVGSTLANNILSTSFKNQRYGDDGKTLATVYKMSYNFVERTYPYTIQGNNITFRINLPNKTPFADLELFKYAMDIRVRFTKTKASINPPQAIPEAPAEAINVGLDLGTLVQCEEDCQLNEYEKRDCRLGCEQPREQPQEQECKTGTDGKVVCTPKSSTERTPNCIERCGRQKCMTKCNRAVGGVGRVLGFVGDDFSVVDFLNLYTRS